MLPANSYIELLPQLQEAYAIHGRYFLWLGAVTPEEFGAYPFLRDGIVGVVPLRQSTWYIVGEIMHASRFGASEAYGKLRSASLEAFCELASRAGAALPLSIRRKISGCPDHTPAEPLSWWVTFLWHLSPPSEVDLAPREGQAPPTRIACLDPFQASIDAIESCGLHTDQPRFPPDDIAAEADTRTPTTVEPHPDGPDGGRWFWWKNNRYDVPQGTVYRLLAHMWDRDSARYNGLEKANVFDSAVAPQTVRSYANKANNALPPGFPWRLSADSVSRQLSKVPSSKGTSGNPSRMPKKVR